MEEGGKEECTTTLKVARLWERWPATPIDGSCWTESAFCAIAPSGLMQMFQGTITRDVVTGYAESEGLEARE
jgi:hypothetical protein